MKNIFIVGQSGATGVELLNYLENCDFKDKFKLSYSEHNETDLNSRINQMSYCDIVVLCTPSEVSRDIAYRLENFKGVIIDTSDNFRHSPDWLYAYNINKALLKNVNRISNPGCFAQGMISLLDPISVVLKRNNIIQVNGITGFSAGGKNAINKHLGSNFTTKFTNIDRIHTHEAEVNHFFNNKIKVMFVPQVGNFVRGQSVGVVLKATDVVYSTTDSFNFIKDLYRYHSHINLLKDSSSIYLSNMNNGLINISVTMPSSDRIILNACYDNLNIGSAGNIVKILNDII